MIAVQLNIPYESLLELVEQLPEAQQQDLARRLQKHLSSAGLTVDEKLNLLRSAQFNIPVKQEPSPRREDWYN